LSAPSWVGQPPGAPYIGPTTSDRSFRIRPLLSQSAQSVCHGVGLETQGLAQHGKGEGRALTSRENPAFGLGAEAGDVAEIASDPVLENGKHECLGACVAAFGFASPLEKCLQR
jgi:hypothetical protein